MITSDSHILKDSERFTLFLSSSLYISFGSRQISYTAI